MLLTLNPLTLPGSNQPCLYAYHKSGKVKLGLSTNLRNRNAEYKGRGFACVGYLSPVLDLRAAEKSLSALFRGRFKPLHRNGEWFEGERTEVEIALTEWLFAQG